MNLTDGSYGAVEGYGIFLLLIILVRNAEIFAWVVAECGRVIECFVAATAQNGGQKGG